MSRGSMLMGMARGKLGEFVYARVKGQQVQRAYNSEPYNPQTSAQLYQRSLFTDAVKFYTRGRRQLFPFAFEDKKKTESDYNAFMRVNAKRGVVISKECFESFDYPALGNFILSKGTLPPMRAIVETSAGTSKLVYRKENITTELTAVSTVGDLASLMIDGVDFLDGDIITLVEITGPVPQISNIPSVTPSDDMTPSTWDIKQFMLTANSTQPISDFGIIATLSGETTKTLTISPSEGLTSDFIFAGVIIHSRNAASKVRVSTEELSMNQASSDAIEAARERAYVDAAVESWRIKQKAPVISETIIQGNIAQSIAADFDAGE